MVSVPGGAPPAPPRTGPAPRPPATSSNPARVTIFTVGKIPWTKSGPARPHVLLRRVDQRLGRPADRLVARRPRPVQLLERGARVLAARSGRGVVGLLVPAPGDVVLEDPPLGAAQVVAGEDGHDHETLHRHRQVHPDHLAELVGLALEGQAVSLHLLVVLELGLEEAGHLDRRPGRPGDRDHRVVVGPVDLLDPAVGDLIALGRLAVAGDDDAVGVPQSEDRRAEGDARHAVRVRRDSAAAPRGPRGEQVGRLLAQEVHEAGAQVTPEETLPGLVHVEVVRGGIIQPSSAGDRAFRRPTPLATRWWASRCS